MDGVRKTTYRDESVADGINRLPPSCRAQAAEGKYARAVEAYACSDLSLHSIARMCGVSASGLSAHLSKHHRPLLLARYGLSPDDGAQVKAKSPLGQSQAARQKYGKAVDACSDAAYIEFNVAQIARIFGLDGSALASQLRMHYPDVIPARESLRRRLGIADNAQRGLRPGSAAVYAEALAMYRSTSLPMNEVALRCGVSPGGFGRYMRFYHRDLVEARRASRRSARAPEGERRPGLPAANGSLYGPKPDTAAKYAQALDLYRASAVTMGEAAESAGVPKAGFKGYMRQWGRFEVGADRCAGQRRRLTKAAAKYAPAIESLRSNPRPLAGVAADFGLDPDVFRAYVRKHEPSLADSQGMVRSDGGRLVKRSASEKYARAIEEYAASAEPLKSIAQRHGIVYNSLLGYVMRNCPSARERHRRLARKSQ